MKPHRIVLLGPPASGKGTQGRLMEERWHVPVVSAGDVLRSEIAANTPLGQEAARYMTDGGLVPDRVALAAVEGWLDTHGEEVRLRRLPAHGRAGGNAGHDPRPTWHAR